MARKLRPMWWVMDKATERTIAICDNETDANTISKFYKKYKDTECVIRVAFID